MASGCWFVTLEPARRSTAVDLVRERLLLPMDAATLVDRGMVAEQRPSEVVRVGATKGHAWLLPTPESLRGREPNACSIADTCVQALHMAADAGRPATGEATARETRLARGDGPWETAGARPLLSGTSLVLCRCDKIGAGAGTCTAAAACAPCVGPRAVS